MTVLITGGSKGIGLALAEVFAEQGRDLVLVARDSDALMRESARLREEFGVGVTAIRMDLSSSAAHLKDALDSQKITVTGLVNNAGFGFQGSLGDSDVQGMIDLNISSLTNLTRLFLPQIEESRGFVVNVASVAGLVPIRRMAVYAATKAYVVSFSESLSLETSARVLCVCPGPVDTSFHDRAGTGGLRRGSMSAREVARRTVRALRSRKVVVVTDPKLRLLLGFTRWLPRSWIRALSRMMVRD